MEWISFGLGMCAGFVLGGELMYKILKRTNK
jgi:hypothetical protein